MNRCAVERCTKASRSRGMCEMHYSRWKRHGDAESGGRIATAADKIAAFSDSSGGPDACWPWIRSLSSSGYGQLWVDRKKCIASRLAFELEHGPVPEGLCVDHICRNRKCVNPAHLRAVTPKQNAENIDSARSHSRTGVRGVIPHGAGKFRARVVSHGRVYWAGVHATVEAAEVAAISLRNRLHTHNDADRGQIRGV